MFENSYQTIRLPTRTVEGMFPTIDWFNTMKEQVSFKDQSVIDLGCCCSSYAVEAIQAGAKFVTGVDSEKEKIDMSSAVMNLWQYNNDMALFQADIETYDPVFTWNIAIFSMIIHWLKEPEKAVKKYAIPGTTAIFIYRYPQGVVEPGWRPTLDELDKVIGKKHSFSKLLSNTPEQNIMMAIYNV